MQRSETDIAIIGGGIVGLTLALELARCGLSLTLVDKQPLEPPASGDDRLPYAPRVSALTVSSVEQMAALGVWQKLEKVCPFNAMEVWDGEGTGRVHYDAADIHRDNLGFIVENRRLSEALLAAAMEQDNLRILRGTGLGSLEHRETAGEERHHLQLDSGEQLRARLVVGADGGRSRVRELAGFRTRSWDYGHRAIVTTVATERAHQHTAWQCFLGTGPLAFLPLMPAPVEQKGDPVNCVSIVWSCIPALCDELMALDDTGFARRLEQAFEGRLGGIPHVNTRYSFPLRQLHARDYVKPGLALVGDAAHTIHPLAGQGVNLGLQDARALAEVIRGARGRGRDFAHQQSLSAYQRQRKGANLGMMVTMEGFKRLFEQDDLLLRWLRNTGMSALNAKPGIKQAIMKRAMVPGGKHHV